MFEQVIFLQDSEADPILTLIDEEGESAAIRVLKEWHYPGEHDVYDSSSAGAADAEYWSADNYVLSYNTRVGYVGLQYHIIEED